MYQLGVLVHLLAAIVWVGGMLFLALVVVPATRRLPAVERASLFDLVGRRFRAVGWACVALLLATGLVNLSYRGVESESVVLGLDLKGIGVSAGSACTSGSVEPSYVLKAMGVPLEWAMGAVRHSLGRSTSAEDIEYVIECVEPIVRKLRAALPVGAA